MRINIFLPWLLLAILITSSSCLTDIRPDLLKTSELNTQESRRKALEILDRYARYSGSINYDKIQCYEVDLADNYFGIKGRFANPYPNKSNRLRLRYIPGEDLGELLFTKGKNDDTKWIKAGEKSFITAVDNKQVKETKKKAINFWLPTYQHFLEFPFKISEADIIYHAGEKKYGLYNYDLIFVSWKTMEPQKSLDQYVLWINKSSGLLDKVQYTIRDQAGFLKATTIVDEYKNFNGIFLPTLWKVYTNENSTRPLHIMRIINYKFNSFDPSYLLRYRENKINSQSNSRS